MSERETATFEVVNQPEGSSGDAWEFLKSLDVDGDDVRNCTLGIKLNLDIPAVVHVISRHEHLDLVDPVNAGGRPEINDLRIRFP